MRSFSIFNLILATVLLTTAGCKKATYRKSPGGMPYQLFKSGDTTRVMANNIVKLSFTQKVNDSVYFTNTGKPAFYTPVTATPNPYDLTELWLTLAKGDSVVTVQMMDTFMKRSPGQLPPHFKKGDKITTYVKILDVFRSAAEATEDEQRSKKQYQENEVAEMARYLEDKKITAQRTASGAFVSVINAGNGPEVDTGKFVSVNYTGTSFSGKRFDSTTDTAFHHVQPYGFVAGTSSMILGFDEAVLLLRKGATAKIYLPSMLAYGPNPGTPNIKPYEHLIFDLEVVDVQDKAPQTNMPMPAVPDERKIKGGNQ